MKVEATLTIEADLLERVDFATTDASDRSDIVEKALKIYLPTLNGRTKKRKLTREEEIEVMNRFAVEHREEILENLEYQIDL